MCHMTMYFVTTRYIKYLIHICFTSQNYIRSLVERYHMKINLFFVCASHEKLF
jgi:hypothetical protein